MTNTLDLEYYFILETSHRLLHFSQFVSCSDEFSQFHVWRTRFKNAGIYPEYILRFI